MVVPVSERREADRRVGLEVVMVQAGACWVRGRMEKSYSPRSHCFSKPSGMSSPAILGPETEDAGEE